MGIVWRAHDNVLGEDVALKFLPDLVRWDQAALRELKAETRRARTLTHPNIVRIHDLIEDVSGAAISMEFVEGRTLTEVRLERPHGVLEPADILPWLGQLCSALDYAHAEAKIVHRDLKPANLLLTAEGRIKVTDFGVARSLVDTMSRVSTWAPSGTLLYMSPQQAMGEPPSPADDLYSLGALLYELITGKPPFHTGNVQSQINLRQPDSLAQRRRTFGLPAGDVPAAWEKSLAACLAKKPEDRPASAGVLAIRLTAAPTQPPGRFVTYYVTNRLRPFCASRPILLGALALTLGLAAWAYRPWVANNPTSRAASFASDATRALAAWNFDGDGQDASGRGLHLAGSRVVPTADRHGRIDRALHFNGNSSLAYDNFPAAGWSGAQPFTVALWVCPDSAASMNSTLVSLLPTRQGEPYWSLVLGEGRPIFSSGKMEEDDPDQVHGKDLLPAGRWSHVSAVCDGRQLQLYLDGRPAGASPVRASRAAKPPDRATLTVGFANRLDSRRFAGDLDNLRIWRRSLTAGEIAALAAPTPPPVYELTHGTYSEKEDLAAVAVREFGSGAQLADWDDLRRWHSDDTRNWVEEIGLQMEGILAHVQKSGQRISESPRHYFVSRFDGRKPDYYLAHDELGGMTLALGSWYGGQMRALVGRPFSPPRKEGFPASTDGPLVRAFAHGELTGALAVRWKKEFLRNPAGMAVRAELRLRNGRTLLAEYTPSNDGIVSLSLGEAAAPKIARQMGASYDILEFTLVARAGLLRFRAVSVRGAEPLFMESAALSDLNLSELAELRLSGVDAAELTVEK